MLADKMNNGRIIIDLVRMFEGEENRQQYQGICW
jgi:hypothetical protein